MVGFLQRRRRRQTKVLTLVVSIDVVVGACTCEDFKIRDNQEIAIL